MISFISIFLKWLMFSYFFICSFITANHPKKYCCHWVGEFHRSNTLVSFMELLILQTNNAVTQSIFSIFTLLISWFSSFQYSLNDWCYFVICSFIAANHPKKYCCHWVGEFHSRSCMYYHNKNVKFLLSVSLCI